MAEIAPEPISWSVHSASLSPNGLLPPPTCGDSIPSSSILVATSPRGAMKNIVTKAAVIACLFSPVPASAHSHAGSIQTDTFSILSSVSSGLFNATIDYSWSDMSVAKSGTTSYRDASPFGWTLTNNGSIVQSGSITDPKGRTHATGSGVITLTGLSYSEGYLLTLSGTWAKMGGEPHARVTAATVNLLDATYQSVSAVPEPESYAMLLAGLGLIGTIAIRRRNQNNA